MADDFFKLRGKCETLVSNTELVPDSNSSRSNTRE
jgi:hypothetical protein